jgi:DNA polymerase I-like protein with 3'-5' exonuclease and polymerase domains
MSDLLTVRRTAVATAAASSDNDSSSSSSSDDDEDDSGGASPLERAPRLLRCYWLQEEPFLTTILLPLEAGGVAFDPRALARGRGDVIAALTTLERRALAIAGPPAPLLTSPEQVSQVLYGRLRLPRLAAPTVSAAAARAAAKRSGSGSGSGGPGSAAYHTTSQAVLSRLAHAGHEFPRLLLRFRALHRRLRHSADLMVLRAAVSVRLPSPASAPAQVHERAAGADAALGAALRSLVLANHSPDTATTAVTLHLHPQWHQTGTGTGRLSCSRPNIQATPRRLGAADGAAAAAATTTVSAAADDDDDGADDDAASSSTLGAVPPLPGIRDAVTASSPLSVLLAADYAQMEVRVVAALCRDPTLRAALAGGGDLYRSLAAQCFSVAPEAVAPTQRDAAKTLVLGILYGMGAECLAQKLAACGATTASAAGAAATAAATGAPSAGELVAAFAATYPRLQEYARRAVAAARRRGGVRTLAGRPRWMPALRAAAVAATAATGSFALVGPAAPVQTQPQAHAHATAPTAAARAYAERQVLNSIVQGSASDLIKRAMLAVRARFLHRASTAESAESEALWTACRPVAQLHDEVIYEVPARIRREAAAEIRAGLEETPTRWQAAMNALRRQRRRQRRSGSGDGEEDVDSVIAFPVKIKSGRTWGAMEPLEDE